MKLTIRGTPTRLTRQEIREACNYYAEQLLPPRVLAKLKVEVILRADGDKGGVVWIDREVKPRVFKLDLNSKFGRLEQLKTIAHEFTHIKQFATGQLREWTHLADDDVFVMEWLKTDHIVSREETDSEYYLRPWEIDAYGYEVGLYRNYLKHAKTQKRLARQRSAKRT